MNNFEILILDLHNTIYDEVMEYGLALEAAVDVWINALKAKNIIVSHDEIYAELATAHRLIGSDWDNEVWRYLPILKNAGFLQEEFEQNLIKAIDARLKTSHKLTLQGVYDNVVDSLKKFKNAGKRIYIVTEAVSDIAMQALKWLDLTDVVSGVYTYPSKNPPQELANIYQKTFPLGNDGKHLKKPSPILLAQVIIDYAKNQQKIPHNIELEEIFDFVKDESLALSEFDKSSPIQEEITQKLLLKNSEYKQEIQNIMDNIIYVGDSKFKDGIMSRNAGVKFAFAAYGKKITKGSEAEFARSKDILYKATGWDKEIMRLTQEASGAKAINNLIPDFYLENGLA
ncbi:MAG: HAD family hydrolase [Pseudomonadota bacterium]